MPTTANPALVSEGVAGVPLTDLAVGERGRLEASGLAGGERRVLEAMGLVRGSVVRIVRAGEPCIVQVNSTRLALAGPVARKILVTPLGKIP